MDDLTYDQHEELIESLRHLSDRDLGQMAHSIIGLLFIRTERPNIFLQSPTYEIEIAIRRTGGYADLCEDGGS
jgi:hypothetical protein